MHNGRLFKAIVASFVAIAFVSRVACLFGQAADLPGDVKGILTASGVQGGLVVHLGCGDGKRTAAFGAAGPYLVHGLDRDHPSGGARPAWPRPGGTSRRWGFTARSQSRPTRVSNCRMPITWSTCWWPKTSAKCRLTR